MVGPLEQALLALMIAVISAVMIFRFHLGIGKTLIVAGLLGLAARFLL